MGTHPIFESDFDCLTDLKSIKTCQDPLQPPMSVKAQKAEELPEQEVLDHKFDREEPEEHRLVKKSPQIHLDKWALETCGNSTPKIVPELRLVPFQFWLCL